MLREIRIKKDREWKEKIKCILVIFFLTRFVNYSFLSGIIQQIYSLVSIVIAAYIIIRYFVKKNFILYKKDLIIIIGLFYFGYTLLITVVGQGSAYKVFSTFYPIIATMMFISMECEKNPVIIIDSYAKFLLVLMILNFLDTLTKDNTTRYATTVYLLGGQNQYGIIFAIGFCFVSLAYTIYEIKKWKLYKIIYIAISILTALIMQSTTTIICVLAMLVFIEWSAGRRIINKFSGIQIYIGYAVIWIALVIYRVQDKFADLIFKIFQKNATLTYRTNVWDTALGEIKQHFLCGHGMQMSSNLFDITIMQNTGKSLTNTLSAHNQILQNIYEVGLIGLVLFSAFFLLAYNQGKKVDKIGHICCGMILVILIAWLTETPGMYSIMMGLTICYYCKSFQIINNDR